MKNILSKKTKEVFINRIFPKESKTKGKCYKSIWYQGVNIHQGVNNEKNININVEKKNINCQIILHELFISVNC